MRYDHIKIRSAVTLDRDFTLVWCSAPYDDKVKESIEKVIYVAASAMDRTL